MRSNWNIRDKNKTSNILRESKVLLTLFIWHKKLTNQFNNCSLVGMYFNKNERDIDFTLELIHNGNTKYMSIFCIKYIRCFRIIVIKIVLHFQRLAKGKYQSNYHEKPNIALKPLLLILILMYDDGEMLLTTGLILFKVLKKNWSIQNNFSLMCYLNILSSGKLNHGGRGVCPSRNLQKVSTRRQGLYI